MWAPLESKAKHCNPIAWEAKAEDGEFQASLDYTVTWQEKGPLRKHFLTLSRGLIFPLPLIKLNVLPIEGPQSKLSLVVQACNPHDFRV